MKNGIMEKEDILMLADTASIVEAHGGTINIPFMGCCSIGISKGPHTDTLCIIGEKEHLNEFVSHHEFKILTEEIYPTVDTDKIYYYIIGY